MSLLTKLSNKIQHITSKQLDDPETEAYIKQQKIQEAQDAAAQQRQEKQNEEEKKAKEKKAAAAAKAADIARRSEFKPGRVASTSASKILKIFGSMVLTMLMLYGGHLAANEAIGYRNPFRLLSFLYGALLFIYVIPKSFYDSLVLKKDQHFYTFLPLSTYVPVGNFESFFLTPFCYTEDGFSAEARKAVHSLYENAFKASTMGKAVGTVVAAAVATAANSAKPKAANAAKSKVSEAPKAPNTPKVPEAPATKTPNAPKVPEAPNAPEAPKTPNAPTPEAPAAKV